MALSGREQRALSSIADEIAGSDPQLASILAFFNRLTRGEEMPAGQRAGSSRQREAGRSHRVPVPTSKGPAVSSSLLFVTAWILISAALITVAIVLINTGNGSDGLHATRVAQDIESADLSGVSGTPTFFINGQRHYGAFDLPTLTTAIRTTCDQVVTARPAPLRQEARREGGRAGAPREIKILIPNGQWFKLRAR